MNWKPSAAALLILLLAGCAGVPDKLPPPTTLRNEVPLAGLPMHANATWPDPEWWHQYHDPQLDQLIDMALKGSTSLAAARSRVEGATQATRIAAAQAGLRIDGSAQVARHRLSKNSLIPSRFLGFTWYNQGDIGAQLSYDFDWWGKKRASIEAAVGHARAAEAQRSAAALAVQVAVVNTYFGWSADRARLSDATQLVKAQEQVLHIEQVRVRAGLEPVDNQHQAEAQLAAARQQQVALDGSARTRRAALAALLGVAPAKMPVLTPRPLPKAIGRLPANASLDLIARRPDIAASRWQVQAALRQTDVARAQFFPDFSISALAGFSSIDLGKLLDPSSRTFAVTPALHLPIFEGGLLRANYGLSKAKLDGAIAQYNNTVLDAAREVATQSLTVQRLAAQRHQQQAQLDAVAAIGRNTEARRRQGLTDARPALQAQVQLLQLSDTAIQLHAEALSADVGLMRALGGGYHSSFKSSSSTTPSTVRTDSP